MLLQISLLGVDPPCQPINGGGDAAQMFSSMEAGSSFPLGSGVVNPTGELLAGDSLGSQGINTDHMRLRMEGTNPVNTALENVPLGSSMLGNIAPTGQLHVIGALGPTSGELDNNVSSQMVCNMNPTEQILQPYGATNQVLQGLNPPTDISLTNDPSNYGSMTSNSGTPSSASLYSANHGSDSCSPTNPIPCSAPEGSASQGFYNETTSPSFNDATEMQQLTSNSETQVQYSSSSLTCLKCQLQFVSEEELMRHRCSHEFSNENSGAPNVLMVVKTEPRDDLEDSGDISNNHLNEGYW